MSNKKPLVANDGTIEKIADADNLLLPSMTVHDGGSSEINILTDLSQNGHNHTIASMTGVDLTGITDGQTIKWNGTNFVPADIAPI